MSGPATLLLDTGPWVALHCRDDAFHAWSREQFAQTVGAGPNMLSFGRFQNADGFASTVG